MSDNVECQGIKVLVVDDNLVNQELIKDFFEEVGIEGDFAANGQEGIEKIKQNQYHVCLMDITMPVMDGLQASKIIRETISPDLPIFVVSALNKMSERMKGEYSEITEWIEKPINLKELKIKILLHAKK